MSRRAAYHGRRDILRGLLGLGVAAYGLSATPGRAQSSGTLFRRGAADLPLTALTYDDCFAIGLLQDLERLLAQSPGTQVTFFPVGQALLNTVREDEAIWKRLRDAGHEIGYHTHDHRHCTELTLEEMREDYGKWLDAATAAWGEEPKVRFARPPYAELSDSFRDLCGEKELVVGWWTHDWSQSTSLGRDPGDVLRSGDIALMHPSSSALKMTAEVLDWLPRLGLRAVGISRLHEAWLDPEAYPAKAVAVIPLADVPTASGEPEPAAPLYSRLATAVPALVASRLPRARADLRALSVHVTPMRPRGDAWSCDVEVKVANLGPWPAEDVWAKLKLAPDGCESQCAAELDWRLPRLVPGNGVTLTAREAVSNPAAVLLQAGPYKAMLQVGFEHNGEADGNPANDAIGPVPFELRRPSNA